jgi:hypothetical protein
MQIESNEKTGADMLIEELAAVIERPNITTTNQKSRLWISEKSWKFVDKKSEARKMGKTKLVKSLKKQLAKFVKIARLELARWQIKLMLYKHKGGHRKHME